MGAHSNTWPQAVKKIERRMRILLIVVVALTIIADLAVGVRLLDQCRRSRGCQRMWGKTKWLADQGLIKGIEFETNKRGKTIAKDARCLDVTSIDFAVWKCAVNGTEGVPKWAGRVCQRGASAGATCLCCVKLNLTPEPTPEPTTLAP